MKKIAIIAHSAVNRRQQLFFEELANQGAKVLVLAPKKWTHYSPKDYAKENYEFKTVDVYDEGNLADYKYKWISLEILKKFKPDLIYSQTEFWQAQSIDSLSLAEELDIPLYFFFWENIKQPNESQVRLIGKAEGIVCGNEEAVDIVRYYNSKILNLPQVGVDTERFKPMNLEKSNDVIYLGRSTKEKGIDYIKKAYPPTIFFSNINYEKVPEILNMAKVFVSYPYKTDTWMEQSCGYTVLEALSCGVPCVVSDCGSIPEYLSKCEAVTIIPEKNLKLLKKAIKNYLILNTEQRLILNQAARDFVIENYSNQIVAKKLLEFFNG